MSTFSVFEINSCKGSIVLNNKINTFCIVLIFIDAIIKVIANRALILFINIKLQMSLMVLEDISIYTKYGKQKYVFDDIYQVDINLICKHDLK